jgi:hypothetical protein
VAGVVGTGANCGVLEVSSGEDVDCGVLEAASGEGVVAMGVNCGVLVGVASSGAGVAVIGLRLLLVVSGGGSTKMVMVSLATNISSATGRFVSRKYARCMATH